MSETPARADSFSAVWSGMVEMAKRLVAVEDRPQIALRVGPAYKVAPEDSAASHAREIEINGQRFRVLTVEE